jgi:ribosome recycling factor
MNPTVNKVLKEQEKKMEGAIKAFKEDLGKIRTGRASLSLLDGIYINYYGTKTALNQVASLSVPDSKTIAIQPWETKFITDIEKAISVSDLGLSPVNDGRIIRIVLPPLTEERRLELVKKLKKMAEQAKVVIRNIRRNYNEELKKSEKNKEITEDELRKGLEEVQKITDNFIAKVDEVAEKKEKEIKEI